jgi:hypothetical protein
LLLFAKHLFFAAMVVAIARAGGSRMSNWSASALNSEQDLASIPMAGGRSFPLGYRAPQKRRRAGGASSQACGTDAGADRRTERATECAKPNRAEAAIALKDDCIGFTLARDFDLREIGLLYYVMASSQTLGQALKRLARYSKVTNEALVFGYREGNRLNINLSYSGVPRHSDRHQIEFCMFAALRICRLQAMLTGQSLVPQHF